MKRILILLLIFSAFTSCAQEKKDNNKKSTLEFTLSNKDEVRNFKNVNITNASKKEKLFFVKLISENDLTCSTTSVFVTKDNQFIIFAKDRKDYRIFYKLHFNNKKEFISKIKTNLEEAVKWKNSAL